MSDVKSTQEILEDWLQHPGTALFIAHLDEEWGPGGKRFEDSIDRFADSREDDILILRQIQQIAVTRREMMRLAQWPHEEIMRLKGLDQHFEATPRKPMPLELVGQGRRGPL